MDELNSQPRRIYLRWLVHSLILFIGLAVGSALIYSLQPPKPPPAQMIYDVFLFSSQTPVTDFAAPSNWMQLGVNISADGAPGPRVVSNIQLATTVKTPARLMMSLGGGIDPSFPQLGTVQIDLVGEEVKGKIRTKLQFITGEVASTHRFELGEEEVRVIQLDSGNEPGHHYFYALVRVQPIKPAPPGTTAFPSPAAPGRRRMYTNTPDPPASGK